MNKLDRTKTPSPYDLGELGRQLFREKLKRGYVPKNGSPYDLHHVWELREYYKMNKKIFETMVTVA